MSYKFKFMIPYFLTAASLVGTAGASNTSKDANDTDKDSIDNTKEITQNSEAQADSVPVLDLPPKITGIETRGRSVIYVYDDGTRIERNDKGTRAWRNNNPGNLRYYAFAKNHGAIGEAGGFAVFPDAETGMQALIALLHSESYQKLTLTAALKRYAPSTYVNYVKKVTNLTGLSGTAKLSTFTAEQIEILAKTIRRIEGWVEAPEIKLSAQSDKTDNKESAIAQLMMQRNSANSAV